MKIFFWLFFLLSFCLSNHVMAQSKNLNQSFAIAVHGGAGSLKTMNLSPEQEKAYKDTLALALQAGYNILKNGGTSVDAVQATINVLENSPLFNAGRGSVLTHKGTVEMDAAIMDGNTLKAGAVAGVRTIKNPISAARKILDSSKFILLSGKGAEEFATKHGLEIVDTSYFVTEFRKKQLEKIINSDTVVLDHTDTTGMILPGDNKEGDKFGTVGCVALDQFGNLAAGTSTGGLVNKKFNRIGDSPLIGCGTYANNKSCAISCTGKGEDFIRLVVAHDISSLMLYKHKSLKQASKKVIMEKLVEIGGRGGCICIDKKGNIEIPFNTEGMFRGSIDKKGKVEVMIY